MALPLAVIGGLAQGLGGIAQGIIGGGRRRREQRAAQAEFNRMKSRYEALDTSNPYANVTNTFENLTVNTQAAEFAQQQVEQQSANILAGLQSSAGGGGIAALAQSLANQQQQAAQAASASIAQQEQRNKILAAQGEQRMQQLRGAGEARSQQMEMMKSSNLLQMAAGRKQAADAARQRATESLIGGVAGIGAMAAGGAFKKGYDGGTGGAGIGTPPPSLLDQAGITPAGQQFMNNLSLDGSKKFGIAAGINNPFFNLLKDPLKGF